MSVLSFFRYSFETVLRNRKRSFFAMIGIALALALVSGSFVAVDSSAYGLIRSAIDKVEVDFQGQGPLYTDNYDKASFIGMDSLSKAIDDIESVKNVEKATPIVEFNSWVVNGFNNNTGNYPYYSSSTYLAFLPADSSKLLAAYHVHGAVPETGTVAIPKMLSDALGAGVGDTITCSYVKSGQYYNYTNASWVQGNNSYMNFTLPISEVWTQDGIARNPYYYYGAENSDQGYVYIGGRWEIPVVLNIGSYGSVVNDTLLDFTKGLGWPMVNYQIWIDRDKVIDLADLSGSIANIEFIQHRLNNVGSNWGFNVYTSQLENELANIAPDLQMQKLLFLALSLPVMALGIYLSVVGVDLGINSRRREVGMLKSRGASNRQVFTGLMLEALLLGAIAAVIGLVLGLAVSRLLVGAAADIGSGTDTETFVTDFRISASTIELSIIFGVLLMLLSSYRPFKRVSKTDVAEALHQYSQTTATAPYKARTDIILLIFSGISIVSILIGFDWINNESWSWITRLLLIVLMVIGILAFPLMPFTLSLGVIRLATRGSRRLYSKLTLLVKPWTKEMHELVDRNIVRNPKRASNLGVIIALALAFGLFISVTMESQLAYQRETVKYDVGSDIKLEGSIDGPLPPAADFEAIAGVKQAAMFCGLEVRQATGPYGYGYYANLAMVDAQAYDELVHPSGFYFVDAPKSAVRDLATEDDTILVTSDYAKYNYALVGDNLRMTIDEPIIINGSTTGYKSWSGPVTVTGIVKGLPGLQNYQVFAGLDSISWIPKHNLTAAVHNAGAFIGVEKSANVTSIVSASITIASASDWHPHATTLQEELANLENDIAFGTLSDFLYTEYAMAIAIMSVGVGLIIFVAVTDRQHELACIMARGASGSQMRRMLMGESMSLMILGLSVGAAVGVLTSYLFNTLTQPGFEGVVPHRMVFTWVTLIMIAVSVASLLVASLLATSRAGKMRLSEVLRVRGG